MLSTSTKKSQSKASQCPTPFDAQVPGTTAHRSERPSEHPHGVDYEHEHRDAEHEHEEEPEQSITMPNTI